MLAIGFKDGITLHLHPSVWAVEFKVSDINWIFFESPKTRHLNKQGEENRQIQEDVKEKEGSLTMARSFSARTS